MTVVTTTERTISPFATDRSRMPITRSSASIATLLAVALCSSGCGGTAQLTQTLNTADQPAMGKVADATPIAVDPAGASATEIYSRIATGAVSCWFAAGGPLKKDYVYHATADPPSRGGNAEIIIHQRDATQPNPRGPKSYRVQIEARGESAAAVHTENLKMPDTFATQMTNDVGRWAKGDAACVVASTAPGWAPALPQTAEPTPPKKAKKTKIKSAQTKPAPAQQ